MELLELSKSAIDVTASLVVILRDLNSLIPSYYDRMVDIDYTEGSECLSLNIHSHSLSLVYHAGLYTDMDIISVIRVLNSISKNELMVMDLTESSDNKFGLDFYSTWA